jgi:iron complex transport system ATP-binding protein
MHQSAITIRNVTFSYARTPALLDVSAEYPSGARVSVIGQNGAGKSTLIRCIAGLEPGYRGSIRIDGREIRTLSARDRARCIAYAPQTHDPAIPFQVGEYVMMGRFAHRGPWSAVSPDDRRAVEEALALTETERLRNRRMPELSGGEAQRVMLAGAVAQQPRILLLDEPATFLDPLHQQRMYAALRRVHEQFGMTILMVTHDINNALWQSQIITALSGGAIVWSGAASALTAQAPALLETIYRTSFESGALTPSGRRIFAPAGDV